MPGYYSSSYSYEHGSDSWRPPDDDMTYERSAHVPTRRLTPSPQRRYRSYSDYFPGENNFRPTYRSDEDNGYYERTPSPKPSRRDSDPSAWSPWNRSRTSSWQEPNRIPTSPASSVRYRDDDLTAARMHPPTWRSNVHELSARPDLNSGYSDDYQAQDSDSYSQSYTADVYRPEEPYSVRGHYRRYSNSDSTNDPYVRNNHANIPHSPSVGAYGREYTPASPAVAAPHRQGYMPSAATSATGYTVPPNREFSRPEYESSYRPGWSPTGSVAGRKRESFPNHGRRVLSGHSPANSDSSGQRKASFTRDNRWRPQPFSGSPASPVRNVITHRRYSRSPDQSVQSSRSNSLSRRRLNRSRSSGNRSRSRSPTSSKSNDDPLGARGRSPHRQSSPITVTASGKAVWNRPNAASSGSIHKKSALNELKTRSPSRSSIASSRPSERATSIPAQKGLPPIWNTPVASGAGPSAEPMTDPNGMEVDRPSPKLEADPSNALARDSEAVVDDGKFGPNSAARRDSHDYEMGVPGSEAKLEPETVHMTLDEHQSDSLNQESIKAQPSQPNDTHSAPSRSRTPHLHPTPTHAPMDVTSERADEGHARSDESQEIDRPYSIHTPSDLSDRIHDPIPDRPEAKSRAELLSIVVRTRLLCDRQTREEVINPILISNQMIASDTRVQSTSLTTAKELVREMTDRYNHGQGPKRAATVKASLLERFREREVFLKEKAKRLRAEYLSLHEKWTAHCAVLDDQNRVPVTETELALPTTRSSRRNAVLGDAVRSDLEMEQIIASLGIDEATDPAHLSLRNLAKIPDMISVINGKVDCYYDDSNHLVQNPADYYGPHTGIHDWTPEEKEIFNAKFAAHPKQFGAIADFLPNKTANQCVDYYYLHKKKLLDFRKIVARYGPNKRKRRGMGKNKRNALLADIRQHDAEVSRDGAGSPAGRGARGKRTPVLPPTSKDKEGTNRETRRIVSTRRRFPGVEGSGSVDSDTPTPEPELKPRRGRRPATVLNAIPPPTPPIPTTPIPPAEEEVAEEANSDAERPAKRVKRTRRIKSAAIVNEGDTPEPEANATAADPAESPSKPKALSTPAWSEEDKQLFLTLLGQHGDDFKRISASMPNKTTLQVTNYYTANPEKLDLAAIVAKAPKRSPTPPGSKSKEGTTTTTATESRAKSPVLSLTPDSVRQVSTSTEESARTSQSEVPKGNYQRWPSAASNHPKERASLPATAQYSYYDHMRHTPTIYHPYAQHRSALGPHIPSAVQGMSLGMPTYPAHAHTYPYHAQYAEVHYPAYSGPYTRQVVTDGNGQRRLTPIRPRESAYPYGTHTYQYGAGKTNHAP